MRFKVTSYNETMFGFFMGHVSNLALLDEGGRRVDFNRINKERNLEY